MVRYTRPTMWFLKFFETFSVKNFLKVFCIQTLETPSKRTNRRSLGFLFRAFIGFIFVRNTIDRTSDSRVNKICISYKLQFTHFFLLFSSLVYPKTKTFLARGGSITQWSVYMITLGLMSSSFLLFLSFFSSFLLCPPKKKFFF